MKRKYDMKRSLKRISLFMEKIDYPNERLFKPGQRKSYSMQDLETLLALDADEVKIRELTDEYLPPEVCHFCSVSYLQHDC
eukprot:Seg1384.1 transcript_id=Seg1384.1/GoldUCD/mRNA.D3Y31 product="hypothetical protein" protein_id=Seg1384.1/GoldUCD/D3Y31